MKDKVIASKVFTLSDGRSTRECCLNVTVPVRQTEEGPFGCRYTISVEQRTWEMTIFGEDSLQALLLALNASVEELKYVARKLGLKLAPEEFTALPSPFKL